MAEFPGAVPTNRQSSTSEHLNDMASGFGHVALHNFHNNEIIALATKLGTGISTPSAGSVLRATGTGTSGWGAVDLTTDVTGTLPVTKGGTGVATSANLQTLILGYVYPVGSIYVNATVNTNPGTLLSFGTWTAFGTGRVMVGIDTGQTEFDVAGETGGEKTHTLTTTEMPAHTHTYATDRGGVTYGGGANNAKDSSLGVAGSTTGSAGSDGAHNNLQPYVVVYMWQRTA